MTAYGFEATNITEHLRVLWRETAAPLDVLNRDGVLVRVREVQLVDYPDGSRSVFLDGQRIRKDGEVSRQSRGGYWDWPQALPAALAQVVERARPDWWGTR